MVKVVGEFLIGKRSLEYTLHIYVERIGLVIGGEKAAAAVNKISALVTLQGEIRISPGPEIIIFPHRAPVTADIELMEPGPGRDA
jgi:hypothetical protein